MQPADPVPSSFGERVRECFGQCAGEYEQGARLQAAVAQRLANLARRLIPTPLPAGPRADLGAGSGLLSRALETAIGGEALLRLDNCSALLWEARKQDPAAPLQLWDLNQGLPEELQGATLLASSFALQWLDHPMQQLGDWCKALHPGGWLLLAVPTAGSFAIWHQAAQASAVPFSGLELPPAEGLLAVAQAHLHLRHQRLARFHRANSGGAAFLRQIKAIGAHASQQRRLTTVELRRLLSHWPPAEQPLCWEVLILLGQKRYAPEGQAAL